MSFTVDFGYWRASDNDRRTGLVYWNDRDGNLIYNLPGGNGEEVLAEDIAEMDLRLRLHGWQHVIQYETVEWVRARFFPWQCPNCYGRGYVGFNLVQGFPQAVRCWCVEAPAWL